MASRPTETCSPVEAIMSSSRRDGYSVISWASPSRRLVSPDMAEGTTTTWCPARCHLATRAATLRMRSTEPIEVPPYFWTMRDIRVVRGSTAAAQGGDGETLDYRRCRWRLQEALARIGSRAGLEAQSDPAPADCPA